MIDSMSLALVVLNGTKSESRDLNDALHVMDEEEFRAFYERTARPLWSYLSRITGDRQEADDVLQEAYYRFYRAGARHENETHRRNSLFRIATNVVRDAQRRARHHKDVPLEEEAVTGALPRNARPAPEAQAMTRTDLERAMQQLEPVQREMLWLAYAQGASHEEISQILGIKAVSIRTTLLRARRKLAGFLR
ncbi:MAG TPA: RNA polymerase sigma factor [Thermoanaerobaculia bacterium]|jgi:RNA polymerase sigma-70 factor (ECF subfamily)|nr:RNA polymerase sigma factor [Thermoanaerobaculia bacterium]